MRSSLYRIGSIVSFSALISCSSGQLDQGSLAIVPVENIQLSFDLIAGSNIEYKSFADSKGNVFEITDLLALKTYIADNEHKLLLSDDYTFAWDTLSTSKRLYLISKKNAYYLGIESIEQPDSLENGFELFLTPKSKSKLSSFFANNIGKGLLLIDKNGFVASAEQVTRLDNGNLKIVK